MAEQERFLNGPTMGHVGRMTLAGALGITFVFIVDGANLFWVSRLGDPRMLAALGFAFATALFVSNAAFNALGRSILSSWVQDGVLTLPLAILMAGWYGASGVVYAQAIASIVVGTGAVLWGWQYVNLLSRQMLPPLDLDPPRPYAHADRFRRR